MRPSALILLAALAAAPGAALAQPAPAVPVQDQVLVAQGRIDMVGVAPDACVLNAPNLSQAYNATVDPVSGDRATRVDINQMIDTNTLQAVPSAVYLDFPLICSGPHKVTLTSARGGMYLDGTANPTPTFTDHVSYVMTAQWAGKTATGSTTTTRGIEIDSPDGANGRLYVSIQIGGQAERLFAGSYSDTLTLDVEPAT